MAERISKDGVSTLDSSTVITKVNEILPVATGYIVQSTAAVTLAEADILDGATVSTAELNILDGATVTYSELNYNDLTTGAGTAEASKSVVLSSTWSQSSNVEQISTSGTVATDVGALTTAVNALLTCVQNAALLMATS